MLTNRWYTSYNDLPGSGARKCSPEITAPVEMATTNVNPNKTSGTPSAEEWIMFALVILKADMYWIPGVLLLVKQQTPRLEDSTIRFCSNQTGSSFYRHSRIWSKVGIYCRTLESFCEGCYLGETGRFTLQTVNDVGHLNREGLFPVNSVM